MRIGGYTIKFGYTCWIQTKVPTRVWNFLGFWIFKEANPLDVSRKPQFPLGTRMKYEGRPYLYCKIVSTTNEVKELEEPTIKEILEQQRMILEAHKAILEQNLRVSVPIVVYTDQENPPRIIHKEEK